MIINNELPIFQDIQVSLDAGFELKGSAVDDVYATFVGPLKAQDLLERFDEVCERDHRWKDCILWVFFQLSSASWLFLDFLYFDAWRGLVMSFFCVYLYPSSTSTCRLRRPKAARSGPTSIFSMVSKGDTSFTKIGFDIKSSQ